VRRQRRSLPPPACSSACLDFSGRCFRLAGSAPWNLRAQVVASPGCTAPIPAWVASAPSRVSRTGVPDCFPRVNLFLFFFADLQVCSCCNLDFFLPIFKFVPAVIWIITVESWSSFEPSDKKAQSFFYFLCSHGGFSDTSISCLIKYVKDNKLLYLFDFGCRRLTHGFDRLISVFAMFSFF
jgi:hypothetical protein